MPKGLKESDIQKHGLNVDDIIIHQQRIVGNLESQTSGTIRILDTWRLDNQGILPQVYFNSLPIRKPSGFVSFVPAAGAASRYFQPLQELRQGLSDADGDAIQSALSVLKEQGADQWPLPARLETIVAQYPVKPSAEAIAAALAEIDSPKALQPYQKRGMSFLQKKAQEHSKIAGLIGEVYVAPLGYSQVFATDLKKGAAKEAKKTMGAEGEKQLFLEQGPELSTLRFTRDGMPYRDEHGDVSLVPAGHGMLVRLFPGIQQKFPEAHSLFIRNIDNVIAEEGACVKSTELFLIQYQQVLEPMREIRRLIRANQLAPASEVARQLRGQLAVPGSQSPAWLKELPPTLQVLWQLLLEIFHCPEAFALSLRDELGEVKALARLYDRPVNALGQVPNNGKDVGGSPVRAEHGDGEVSICLELPHASPEDRKQFLEDPKVATHFNPVFVAAELPADINVYNLDQCPFWILAEKNIRGTPVVYHEIVLYEVLGNSYTANVLFPEIPRRLFHPHKTLLDGLKK